MGHWCFTKAFEFFVLELKAQNLSNNTIDSHRWLLSKFFTWAETVGISNVESVQPVHVKMYLAELRDLERSSYYLRNVYSSLRKFYNVLLADDVVSSSPIAHVPKPIVNAEIQPAYTAGEITTLINACPNERDKTLVTTLAGSGLRAFELLALNWSDIDFPDDAIRVRKAKWRQSRTVFVSGRTLKQLYRWHMAMNEPHGDSPVFVNLNNKTGRLSRSRLFKAIKALCDDTGIERKGTHAFRRYYALTSVKAGVPLPLLCKLMGIKNVSVLVKHYLPFLEDEVREAAMKVDVLRDV